MSNEFGRVEGIHLSEEDGLRVVKAVVGEQPLSSGLFASLRRAMQPETLTVMESLPDYDLE